MEAMMDDARSAKFPRWMVVAMYGLFGAGAALKLFGPGGAWGPASVAGVALMIAAYLFAAPLFRSPWWGGANRPDKCLDERELRLRDRAYLRAYRVVGIVPLCVVLYSAMALDDGKLAPHLWLPHSYADANILFWGVFLVTMTLPAAMLAWAREE